MPRASTTDALDRLDVGEADLQAYVSGRLPPDRRAAIAGFLACNPDLAAGVMKALHQQERARLAASAPVASRLARFLRPGFACLICAIAGWAVAEGLDDDGPFRDLSRIPQYVEDAIRSHHVAQVRFAMLSQVETPHLDHNELEQITHIRMPALPEDWQLLDAQVFPSERGPSVSVQLVTPEGQALNLFAVRADTPVRDVPLVTRRGDQNAVYWESGGSAYVLTGSVPADTLVRTATRLSARARI